MLGLHFKISSLHKETYMKTYDVLTIGGGPAGITMAKVLGKRMSVGIIRPEDHSLVYCAMPYVIENKVPLEKTLKSDSLVTDSGADLIRGSVTQVNFADKTVTLESGAVIGYTHLIIATGAEPVLPPIPGNTLKGVLTFKTREDLERIQAAVQEQKLKKAIVVGAGAIGIELAQALNQANVDCRLVDVAANVLPNLVEADFAEELQQELQCLGIQLFLKQKVTEIRGNGHAESVILDNGESIDLDGFGLVVFAVGMRPQTDIFKETPLLIERQGIVINNKMETNIKDVYAVGDCTQFTSGITGEVTLGKLATNAVPMARMLGKNILGANRIYKGFYNGAATKVGKYFVGGTGLNATALRNQQETVTGHAELTTTFPIMPGATKIKMKLTADAKTLRVLGGQALAETPVTDKIDIITLAIQYGLNAHDLAQFSYSAQPYQSFFPANNPIVACAEDIITQTGGREFGG